MRFTIYGRLDGLNEYTNANRKNPYAGAQMKKKNQKAVMDAILACKDRTSFTEPVYLRFCWIEPNKRRDMDNIAAGGRKAILDALVVMNVLENDGWKNVIGFSDRFAVDKDNPRIEVEIITEEEMENRKKRFLAKEKDERMDQN